MAERLVVWLHSDGRRVDGRIAIGTPVMIPQTPEDDEKGLARHAGCEISLQGFEARPRMWIYGEDELQALLLAIQFIGHRLRAFLEDGGRVLDPDTGEDFGIHAYFGSLLRDPPKRD